jgi:ABC-type phosphate transport system substrate-binding protein
MRRLITLFVAVALATWPQAEVARASVPLDGELAIAGATSEALVIVVNRSNPVDGISSVELRSIFLGRRSHWADGKRITLVMREPGDAERNAILRDVCGMNESQFQTHFIRGLYTGEILTSPKILATPAGVRKFIFNVPGAIGYLRLSDIWTPQ